MLSASAVALLRHLAASSMTETWNCTRVARVWDDNTGSWSETPTSVYTGVGKLHVASQRARVVIEAGATLTLHETILALPFGAGEDIVIGDVLECTGSGDDPTMIGTRVQVTALPLGSQMSTRELAVTRETPS